MTKPIPEATEFAALRAKHNHEWPQDVKDAAFRVQMNLDVANGAGFKRTPMSSTMEDGLERDLAEFRRLYERWLNPYSDPSGNGDFS